jgi:hypothetical protein
MFNLHILCGVGVYVQQAAMTLLHSEFQTKLLANPRNTTCLTIGQFEALATTLGDESKT